MKRNGDKVIYVHLATPYQGEEHYFFGSVAAIYDVLPVEVVGATKDSLWKFLANGNYTNKKASFIKGMMLRKNTNRKKPQ